MRLALRSLLTVASVLIPAIAFAQTWANEPSGSTQVLDCPFAAAPSACGIFDVYSSAQVGSNAGGLVSPSSVIISTLNAGQLTGGMQLEYVIPGGGTHRDMFVGMSLFTNAGFQGRTVGNKMFFMKGPDSNGVFLFGNSSLSGGQAQMIFAHNTGGGLDNSHACADPFGATCYPNVGSGVITVGTPTKLQAYIKCSTTSTSRDGIVQWWVNGTMAGNYTNLNYCPAGLNIWAWTETWDGSPCCTFATVDWKWFLDHLYVSLPNCSGSCTGVGGDTTPPSQVTGVSVSMNGTTAALTWSAASDNVGISAYTVEKCTPSGCSNWALDQTVSGLSASVGSLTAGVSYAFRVRASDTSGNFGAYSSTVTGTTTADVARTLATDTFNRANGVLGTNWTGSYSTMGDLTIVSNAARATGSNDAAMFYNALSSQTDQWAMVDITAATGTQAYAGGVTLHAATPPTPTFYTCRLLGNGWTGAIMDKFVNNAYTLLGSNSGATWAAGDQLKCTIRGNALTMTRIRSGVETVIITATDSGIPSGNAGILIYSPTAANLIVDNFTVGDWTAAAVAPTITAFTPDATGANVTWTGSPAYIRVQTYTATGIFSDVVEPIASFPAGRYSHVWEAGINSGCIFAQDADHVENTNVSAYRCSTIVPNPPADTTPPVISNPLPTGVLVLGTTSTPISVSTNESAVCKWDTSNVAYASMGNTFSTTNGMSHSSTKSSLSNGTSYTVYVRCIDGAGNANTSSSTIAFSVDSAPAADSTAPSTVTGLSCLALSTSQIQCSWTAATDNVAVSSYLLYACVNTLCADYALVASPAGTSSTIAGLIANRVYRFTVEAVDTSGNISAAPSTAVEVTTLENVDVVPPSTMMNLRESAAATYATASLQWDVGIDNVGVSQSLIERCAGESCTDFQTILSASGTIFSDSSVKFGTSYRYRGKHRDTSGNVSLDYSDVLTVIVPNPPVGIAVGVCPCKTH